MSQTDNTTLSASSRVQLGTGSSKKLRQTNQIPAVIYGLKKASQPIVLLGKELQKLYRENKLLGHIVALDLQGKKQQVLVQTLQTHPLRDEIMHLELFRVEANQKISAELQIEYQGEQSSPAAKNGGQIIHFISSLKITCLPADLPDHIIVDVSQIELDHTLHISDITLPTGVSICATTPNTLQTPVCVFHLPKKEEVLEESPSHFEESAINSSEKFQDDNPPEETT